jgi:hypothetical protein
VRTPTWWWLRQHRRHGTGPIKHKHTARDLDRHGDATGPLMLLTWFRCECAAVRTVSKVRAPADG